jgi:segregation and condensation protein B
LVQEIETQQESNATDTDARFLAALEAILFVAGEPVNLPDLRKALDVEMSQLDELLEKLNVEYLNAGRGLRVMRHAEQVQLVSAPQVAVYIERYIGTQSGSKLSAAALETLMVVAYRQPVTRSGIEAVRGVDSSGVINTLQARGLIEEVGRAETIGHPALFGTTVEFLHQFGLNSLNDLPHVEGLSQPKSNESSS